MKVIGVMSTIEGPIKGEILNLWELCEQEYQTKGVKSFDHPNITYQGGFTSDITMLEEALEKVVDSILPYELTIEGFGFFENPDRVIFLKVLQSEKLKYVHNAINNVIHDNCAKTFQHYSPENWIPHITIAMSDLSEQNFIQAQKALLSKDFPLTRVQINNIRLVKVDKESGRIDIIKSWTSK